MQRAATLFIVIAMALSFGSVCWAVNADETQTNLDSIKAGNKLDFASKTVQADELKALLSVPRSAAPKGVTISNLALSEHADFTWLEMESEIHFINCKFEKGLVLKKAQSARNISFRDCEFHGLDCQFLNSKDGFTLNSCKIYQSLTLKSINLQGDFVISDCVIVSDLLISLQSIVSQNLFIRNSRIEGNAPAFSFQSAKIQGDFEFSSVDCKPAVDLTDGTVGGSLNFGEKSILQHATDMPRLAGGLYGKRLSINGDLVLANWTIGTSPNSCLDLRGCQAKGGIYLHGLAIPHYALIAGARSGNGLSVRSVTIARGSNPPPDNLNNVGKERKTVLSAEHLNVAGPTIIENCVFMGNAQFSMSEFHGEFQIKDSTFKSKGHPLGLNGVTIHGGLYIDKFGLGTKFVETVKLEHAKIETLSFYSATLAKGRRFSISGLSCDTVIDRSDSNPKNKETDASSRLRLLQFSQPDPTACKDLELVFRKRGQIELADETYIRLRRQQRSQMPWYNRLADSVWCVSAGYGRKPTRVLFGAMFFVFIGAVIFWLSEMKLQQEHSGGGDGSTNESTWIGKIDPIWYSIILFLPFENTQMVDRYLPTNKYTRWYRSLHVVMGWVAMSLIFVIIASRLVN